MLPLLKKNSVKAKALEVPAWHTNFRNYALLPDTKLVRTSFFVNGLLAFAAIGLLLAGVYQEYELSILRKQNVELQQQIEKNRPLSDQAQKLFKNFSAEEKKTNELNAFVKGQKLSVSDFIIHLSSSKPASIVFVSLEYNDKGANIRGYAQGSSEQTTGAASSYEKQLKEDKELSSVYKSISMTNVSRDAQAGRLSFDIVLSFTAGRSK